MFGGRRRSKANSPGDLIIPPEKTMTGLEDSNNNNNGKLYSRLLSRENNYPSVRVYYGEVSVAVPFTWESQPGTPKYRHFSHSSDDLIPPLTPPPSYFSNSSSTTTPLHHTISSTSSSSRHLSKNTKKNTYSLPNFISFLSRSSSPNKPLTTATSSDSSFTSSSSTSSVYRRRKTDSLLDHEPSSGSGSPTSILCFGGSNWRRGRYGCL